MPLLGLYRDMVRRRYQTPTRADEIHRVLCADGVRVCVKRCRPAPGAALRALPVLCVPGLGADSTNFDAPAPHGLAPWLAAQGFDTWIVDLRGTGLSMLAGRSQWSNVTFDDFVHLDMPAVLEHIAVTTGAPSVSWVGHSMGGLLLYAMVAAGRAGRVHAGVTLGSPIGFPRGFADVPWLGRLRGLGRYLSGLHVQELAQLLTPFAMRFDHPQLRRLVAYDNVDPAYVRRVMYRAIQSVPRGVLAQLGDWMERDAFCSVDGTLDYRARLSGCALPVLVMGGQSDGIARLDAVRRAVDLLPNAEHVIAGRAAGFTADYGHIDLLFGKRAHVEIYPRVRAFLAAHDHVARRTPLRVAS